jgi:hypothetical protein
MPHYPLTIGDARLGTAVALESDIDSQTAWTHGAGVDVNPLGPKDAVDPVSDRLEVPLPC